MSIKENESSTAFCFKLCTKQGNTVSDFFSKDYSTQLKGWVKKLEPRMVNVILGFYFKGDTVTSCKLQLINKEGILESG